MRNLHKLYVSSKAAIERLTEALSLELAGKNIQVNVMGPGAHRTRMVEELLDEATALMVFTVPGKSSMPFVAPTQMEYLVVLCRKLLC